MQVQKLASLGAADAGFFAQLSRQTEAMQRILQTPGGPKHEDLARLRGMVDSARAVLSDLMAFSSSGSQDTDQIVLNDAVDSVQELVQSFAHNSIHFDVELPKTSPIVQGNLGWVHQTVLNLLLTAQESAIGGGTIKVRVAEGPAPDVDDGNGSAVYASVSVTDATPRKEQIKFDPESKLYTTAKNNLNAGIRLTAAHAIAERHGGMLRLNGGGGERLTVSLFFPIAKP
jgi:signal transduction histidine kinase